MDSNSDVFATLTYSRSKSIRDTWLNVTSDFNRFSQRVQRKIGYLEYLRVFENHKDNYPHIHAHLRFRDVKNIRERGIYLHDKYFRALKSCWTHGHTDYQCPKYSNHYPIAYVLKYIGKSTSSATLWQQILNPTFKPYTPPTDSFPIPAERGENIWKLISIPLSTNLYSSRFKWKRIKLLSWSRGYVATFKK